MLTVLSILGVLVVLFIAAAVATREGPILADAPVDRADLGLPDGELQPEDLHAVRFSMAVRGYRMDEVDRVLDRAAEELARRDQRILELRAPAAVTSVVHPAPSKPAPADVAPASPTQPAAEAGPVTIPEPQAVDPDPSDGRSEQPAAATETLADDSDRDAEPPSVEASSPEPPAAPPADVAVVPVELAPLPESASVDVPSTPTGGDASASRD